MRIDPSLRHTAPQVKTTFGTCTYSSSSTRQSVFVGKRTGMHVAKLVTAVFQYPATMEVLSTEKVPVSVERTANRVKFSVPASTVEIEMMEGRDGKPIKIHNLPYPGMVDYTQYKSVITAHKSEDKEFSYSGTNGVTSWMEAESEE